MPTRSIRSAQSGERCGFSLVELLLVLAVMGCIGALTWPRPETWRDSMELDRATERLRARLQEARRLSVEAGVPVAFECQCGGRVVRIRSVAASVPETITALPERFTLHATTDGKRTEDWTTLTTFRPDGSASASRLTIWDERGATRLLIVDRATGAVSLRDTSVFRQEE